MVSFKVPVQVDHQCFEVFAAGVDLLSELRLDQFGRMVTVIDECSACAVDQVNLAKVVEAPAGASEDVEIVLQVKSVFCEVDSGEAKCWI